MVCDVCLQAAMALHDPFRLSSRAAGRHDGDHIFAVRRRRLVPLARPAHPLIEARNPAERYAHGYDETQPTQAALECRHGSLEARMEEQHFTLEAFQQTHDLFEGIFGIDGKPHEMSS